MCACVCVCLSVRACVCVGLRVRKHFPFYYNNIRSAQSAAANRRKRERVTPGATTTGVSPVPVQMWAGVRPVPAQMWAGVSPVPAQMWAGVRPALMQMWAGVSPIPAQMWAVVGLIGAVVEVGGMLSWCRPKALPLADDSPRHSRPTTVAVRGSLKPESAFNAEP